MFFLQLRQLMWKNFLIRSRSKFRLIAEILWPLTIFIILALVRTRGLKLYQSNCFLEEKALPSAGSTIFYRNLLCTVANTCHDSPTTPLPFAENLEYENILTQLQKVISKHEYEVDGGGNQGFKYENIDMKEGNPLLKLLNYSSIMNEKVFQQSNLWRIEELKDWPCPSDGQLAVGDQLANFKEIADIDNISHIFQQLAETPIGKMAILLNPASDGQETNSSTILQVLGAFCGKPIIIPESFSMPKSSHHSRSIDTSGKKMSIEPNLIDLSPEASGLSEKCSALFNKWQDSPYLRTIFTVFYPFIRGKLVYSPSTPAFERVIQNVNETFQDLKQAQDVADNWLNVMSPQITNILNVLESSLTSLINTCPTCLIGNVCDRLEQALIQVYRIQNLTMGIDYVANFTTNFVDCYEFDKFLGFDSEEEAVVNGIKLLSEDKLWAVIVFEDDNSTITDQLPEHVVYKIRMDKYKVDDTSRVEDYNYVPIPRTEPKDSLKYFSSGFIFLQDKIERAIIELQSNRLDLPQMYMEQIPFPCSIFDEFLFGLGPSFPLFMNLAFVFACAMIVKSIVYEKEKRLKETMRTMGLGNAVHWVAWFIDSMAIMTVVCILLPIILYFGKVLENSDPTVLFVFLFTFCLANVTFSFLISTLFSRANLAAACGAFIYFIAYQPYALIYSTDTALSLELNIVASLLANIVFGMGNTYIIRYEELGIGAQWNNIAVSPLEGDPFSLLGCILMQLADTVIYMLIALYIETVFPGMYGVPKPWYFPFQPSFWCSSKRDRQLVNEDSMPQTTSDLIEEESSNLPVGVSIRNLGKTFSNGKQAVKNLNLDFYQNQITSFLGHNGAGKTTTISILTGLYTPTTGTATINGFDIRYQMDDIRQQLGLCPQFNVLFEQLTVLEHLIFYASLKTGKKIESKKEIDKMIDDLGLSHKRDEMSQYLSGGMKRKLSIGAAFIGNSKTVILDEPTAGVDPYSRRSIWEILLKYKEGRTIILTTHFMDEADLLGDRIAIISQGQLKCCGTTLFLKRKLGSGYYLTLVRKDGSESTENSGETNQSMVVENDPHNHNEETISSFNREVELKMKTILSRHIPNHFVVQDVGTDLVICLPEFDSDGRPQRSKFPQLFEELETNMSQMNLDSYGVSDTTLEEIFLKVADDPSADDAIAAPPADSPQSDATSTSEAESGRRSSNVSFDLFSKEKITGPLLVFNQIIALYVKRFCNSKRNLKGFFCEIILPAVLLIIGELFAMTLDLNAQPPPLVLSPWLYGNESTTFYANRNPAGAYTNQYISDMLNGTGLGVMCLADDPLGLGMNCSTAQLGLLNPESNPNDYEDTLCDCKLGEPVCPDGVGRGDELWKYGSVSNDQFYDLSKDNISVWIVRTYEMFREKRFGGYEFGVHNDPIGTLDSNVKVWFENKGWATSAAYLNAINNVILRTSLSTNTSNSQQYGITAINHPLDFTNEQSQNLLQVGVSAAFAITVIFALSFVPASFVIFLVEERTSKAKHLQFVSGVKPITFWTAAYTWDLLNYAIPSMILILIFVAFGQWEYVGARSIGGMILLLLLFGVSAIPLMYPASFLFSVPSTAFVALACANLFIGTVTTIASFILQLFDDPGLNAIGAVLNQVFLIFPHFCLGRGMIDMAQVYYIAQNYQTIGLDYTKNIFDWDYLGRYYVSLISQAVVFYTFNLLLHYQVFPESGKRFYQQQGAAPLEAEDEDVAKERNRVEEGQDTTDELRLLGLTKVYGRNKKPATDRLSFGLRKGECFGLLGVNGAGKSTTFKMLTGDETVTAGNAFVGGYSILSNLSEAQQNLGYCPQEDALLPLLTGKEHLELFARLRGVPRRYIKSIVNDNLKKLSLIPYKNRNAGTYSGGNKRKLATAIALIGNPSVIFLDEPSSGMDPRARRSLWQAIIDAVKDERSVLLTSHSMEECQVLCTRLAIMVNGTLRCLGSAQHLKNRFGDGYMINVRCEVETVGEVLRSVQSAIPEATLREQRPRQLIWHIKPNLLPISAIFSRMEIARSTSSMVDYSITQTTLDDVFVRFARLQREINEEIPDSVSESDGSLKNLEEIIDSNVKLTPL